MIGVLEAGKCYSMTLTCITRDGRLALVVTFVRGLGLPQREFTADDSSTQPSVGARMDMGPEEPTNPSLKGPSSPSSSLKSARRHNGHASLRNKHE